MEMAADYHRKLNDSQAAVQFLAGEVDRLSREVSSANESRHSSELVATEWKSRYETGRMDLGAVERELLSARAEADETQEILDEVRRDVARLTEEKTSSYVMTEALREEIAELKNVVNQQKLENAELESIILSQRYSEHPGNAVTPRSENHVASKPGNY